MLKAASLTTDAPRYQRRKENLKARQKVQAARRVESQYGIQLRKIARHVQDMVKGFNMRDPKQVAKLKAMLTQYSKTIAPWARSVATRVLAEISARDEKMWKEHARRMGRALEQEIRAAPTGALMKQLLEEQVTLITSLPLEAAQRVHRLTLEQITQSGRGDSIIAEIMRTGHVTASRATLIARTETARTSSLLTQARAQHIGSEGYIWRTALDSDVRRLHRPLEGRFIRWDSPPVAGQRGERAHAGCIYNCRCYPEPVIPDLPVTRPTASGRTRARQRALAEEERANDQVESLRKEKQRYIKARDRFNLPMVTVQLQEALRAYQELHDRNVAAGYHE